mgnify:FL=1
MNPIFTIHAGEYLFAKQVEENHRDLNCWVPSKDKGVDLLLTGSDNQRTIGVQVKSSRSYLPGAGEGDRSERLRIGGWCRFRRNRLENSMADVWSFVLISPRRSEAPVFINISPADLLQRLEQIHGHRDSYDMYPWVTSDDKALDGRGLSRGEKHDLENDTLDWGDRDFTDCLEDWDFLEQLR